MTTTVTRVLLFLSSYSPLFVLVAVLEEPRLSWWATLPALVAVISCLWLWWFLRWVGGHSTQSIKLTSSKRQDSEVMAYLFTYVLPFLAVNYQDVGALLGLAIFFMILMILYVHANMIHVNPILALLGYHLWEVEDDGGVFRTLLTRRGRLLPGSTVKVVILSDELIMESQ